MLEPIVMSALKLEDIQGFVLRGYRMPMVRHYLLKVKTPAAARALLGLFVNGDEKAAPQVTTAEEWQVGFGVGPGDDPAATPPGSRIIVSTSASPGPGWSRWKSRSAFPSFLSNPSRPSSKERRSARVESVTPAAMRRRTGLMVLEREAIM
jgi:hypothetical protein